MVQALNFLTVYCLYHGPKNLIPLELYLGSWEAIHRRLGYLLFRVLRGNGVVGNATSWMRNP